MTQSIHLTVVIPTRERADTLRHTIRTCVAQSYPNVTFLICDNASTDNTRQVVESFSDPRIRYANIGRRVEMSDNWEFGLGHLAEGYVTFVGDDDGLLWESMAMAAQIIGQTSTSVLVWNKVQYHWPDHILPEQRNHLQLNLSQNIEVLKSKEMMQRLRRYEIGYDSLPCLYNAFVSVPLLHHIRELSGGKFFHGINPDMYSGVALAAFVPQYLRCSFALARSRSLP